MQNIKSGFTLIELLVVILIIGILASVALPQYQKAVNKSRASTALAMLKSLREAQDVYHLANGEYTTDLNKLDIDLPQDAVAGSWTWSHKTKKDQYGFSCSSDGNCNASSANRSLPSFEYWPTNHTFYCVIGPNHNPDAEKLCTSFGRYSFTLSAYNAKYYKLL